MIRWWRLGVALRDPERGVLQTCTYHVRAFTQQRAQTLVATHLAGRPHNVYLCHPSEPLPQAVQTEEIAAHYGPYDRGERDPRVRPLLLLLLVVLLCGVGCYSVPPQAASEDEGPALARIRKQFEHVVSRLHANPHTTWHSGWPGNIRVNYGNRKKNYGLCWQWQEAVYLGVVDTVHAVGWQATGLKINHDRRNAHHALLVYDPERTPHHELLTPARTNESYVLDAWMYGNPDIWRLDRWLDDRPIIKTPPAIEMLGPDGKP